MKRIAWLSFFTHLALFLFVEIIFIFIIFRELPETNLLTLIGILHTSYWFVLVVAGLLRENYAHLIWQKFLCTYIPVVYHVFTHILVGLITIEEMTQHNSAEHSMTWLIIGTICAWVLIALGEYRLHRTAHCETHHQEAHKHCHDGSCEDSHDTLYVEKK